MKLSIPIIAASLLAGIGTAHATVVEFTSGEGYSNGWITAYADWDGAVTNNVVDATGTGYNGATGIVDLSDTAWTDATFTENIEMNSAGDTMTARFRFRYTATQVPIGIAQRGVFSASIVGVETNGEARCGVRRVQSGGVLRLFHQSASGGSNGSSVPETMVGITNVNDTSDWLELTLELVKNGPGAADFIYTRTLSNLVSGVELMSDKTVGYEPQFALYLSPHARAKFSSGWEPNLSGTTNRVLDRFEVFSSFTPKTTVILSSNTGNGGFQDLYVAGTGSQAYTNVPHWFNMGGPETTTCSTDTSMNWNGGGRGGYPFDNRHMVNDTGYTCVSTGEVFSLTYGFATVGANWDGNETNRTYLFTTAVPVDGNITTADRTTVVGVIDFAVTTNVFAEFPIFDAFYTTTASDVGKTFYFASVLIDPSVTKVTNARLDDFALSVKTYGSVLAPWDQFVEDYGITNGPSGDQDLDGENNYYEYVLGGDPTNGAVKGQQPVFDPAGKYLFSLRGDSTLSYSVLTNTDLIFGSWGTNGPIAVGENDGAMHALTNTVGTASSELFMKLIVE